MAQNPHIGSQFDMVRVFKHVARQLGAKNVEDFQLKSNQMQPQVMADEEVMKGVDQGNLIPAGGENA